MKLSRHIGFVSALSALLLMTSCRITRQGVDFSMATDQVMPASNDVVCVEAGRPIATGGAVATDGASPIIPSVAHASGSATTYTVQAGDTLYALARRHHLTISGLAAANGLSVTDHLRVGQKLTIPSPSGAGMTAPGHSGAKRTYTVKPGDTPSGIASRYGVSLQALKQANGITTGSWNMLRVGQKLIIP